MMIFIMGFFFIFVTDRMKNQGRIVKRLKKKININN